MSQKITKMNLQKMINSMMVTIIVRRSNGRDRQKTQKIGRNQQIGRKTVMNQTDMHINMILISERMEEHTDMIRMSEHMDVRTRWTKKETGRNQIIRSLRKHGRKMMENLYQNTNQRRNQIIRSLRKHGRKMMENLDQ